MATQTTGNLTAETKTFYDRVLLEAALPTLIHKKWGEKRPIPTREGQTIQFRRFENLASATTALTEGVTPPGSNITVNIVTATPAQYGDFVVFSDYLEWTAIDPVVTETTKKQGTQAGQTLDDLCRDVIIAGSTVRYANGRAGRTSITSTDVINGVELRKLRRTLRNNIAKPAAGTYYPLIVAPNTMYDLQSMPEWVTQAVYSRPSQLDEGTVAHIYGFEIWESERAKVFTGGGSGGIDVYGSLAIGDGYYGNVDISSHSMETIMMPPGTVNDPLKQRTYVGWKATYVATRLNETFGARLEHAVSA